MLDAIQALSIEAARALSDPEMPRDSLLNGLSVSDIPSHFFFLRKN
jgi:hypothetical protein